ncbi:MAG: endonuclease/exonuclease/phosphatase family protein [Spirochaetales bacterium]|nr:endonuclease/exonuclease/phosphatase family protein [Spirochaetales bacterium]
MNDQIKLTSWNVEWLDKLYAGNLGTNKRKRLDAITEEITRIDADILCIIEGVKGEARVVKFCRDILADRYSPVTSSDGDYREQGQQWIWFLVKKGLRQKASLLPNKIYDEFAGKNWDVHYWGKFETQKHSHYRHPQVMLLEWNGAKMEFIGLHTKSKFVNSGESAWNAGGDKRKQFMADAIKARIKMTTEIANVRKYIDRKFEQLSDPAIIVLGDLNDGPGKEYFENNFLFFDLLANMQGDIFSAEKYLNHALFDFKKELRWSTYFEDFVDPARDPRILLDHIMFTQGLVNGKLPVIINEKAGYVEHEIHDLINANNPKYARTSDHKPVSVVISRNENV